ncbi:MAG: phosphonopyruvate decarboxylase [Gammaproteobacteria bacterium]|jgi:phosphonopyruvate decarboxylase|nr:phosphonopyruvate decarboxylase [Gammaproteobacteria bacterium]
MIEAGAFVEAARDRGFGLFTGVPCSYLKPFINYVIDSPGLRYVGAANEGDAIAIAAGAQLGGTHSIAMFQNSGLGNAVNPLTSLTYTFRVPVLLIPTLRGEPSGQADEPQHELMGTITTDMLDMMQVPWEYFPIEAEQIPAALDRAISHMTTHLLPYALVMRKGSVAMTALESTPRARPPQASSGEPAKAVTNRRTILDVIQLVTEPDTGAVVVATTGYTGRELYACDDRRNQIYMVGSMGCAVSLGLGIALMQPSRRVIVLDGDGAALMRLGAQSTVGYEHPPNLCHVLLDNGIHESTGGQATVARSVNFCAIAAASGYATVSSTGDPDGVANIIQNFEGPAFIHAPIRPGISDELPRPDITPPEVAARLHDFLSDPVASMAVNG